EPVFSTSPADLRRNSSSMNLSSLFISGIEQVRFGEQQQLRLGIRRRLPEAAPGTVPAHDLEELSLFLLEHDHVEREVHDGAQVGVVPGLAEKAAHLGLVDAPHAEHGNL